MAKELDQMILFMWDPILEEGMSCVKPEDEANVVGEHELSPSGPQEPSKIAGMSRESVGTGRDQLMALNLICLNQVIEVAGCVEH